MSNMRHEKWAIQFDTSTDPEANWVSKVNNELNKLPQTLSTESIYRIPHSIKELCSSAYQPQTVSIGPYHHGEPHLEAMEEHKYRALLIFLQRSKKALQWYLDYLAPVVEDLKNAYHELHPKWKQDNEAFLQLMIVDGCFVLEIMRTATASPEAFHKMGYENNDPIFSYQGKFSFIPNLKRDMLKLENQLPLLLLIKLLLAEDCSLAINSLSKQGRLTTLILKFFQEFPQPCNIQEYEACLHILDMHKKSILSRLPFDKIKARSCDCLPRDGSKIREHYILSAVKLNESGISFKRSKTSNLNDISFCRGVLKLPTIIVDELCESVLLNMMAFERFHSGAGHEVRSYVFFMSTIINSAKDARLLKSCDVIYNRLGSDEAVAKLFISLSRDIISIHPESRLHVVMDEMWDYCRSPLPRLMAYAKHNYFTNIWVGLSVVAAIFLFVLTGLQTVYTVLGYYNQKETSSISHK